MTNYATEIGTAEFAERAVKSSKVSQNHFRKFCGLTLTSLGMGTYLGGVDEKTDVLVESAVKRSFQSGAVNVVDSAINYRFQKAERSVGRALKSLVEEGWAKREEFFISTKSGYLAPDADYKGGYERYLSEELISSGVITSGDIVDGSHCMTVPYLSHELQRSLSNLQLGTIDLLYLHNAAEAQIPVVGREEFLNRVKGAFEFFESSRKEKRIRFYGMATWTCFRTDKSSEEHLELEEVETIAREIGGKDNGFRFIQFPYNLAMPEALVSKTQEVEGKKVSLLEACTLLGIGAFVSVPLLQGRLTTSSHAKIPRLHNLTSAQISLQFVRSSPGIIAPLVGYKDPRHLEEDIALAKESPLSSSEFRKVFFSSS
jgi:aryl-alcohol dehydrogenase-like predicted oxidoreductase